jgi:hypothetical protein
MVAGKAEKEKHDAGTGQCKKPTDTETVEVRLSDELCHAPWANSKDASGTAVPNKSDVANSEATHTRAEWEAKKKVVQERMDAGMRANAQVEDAGHGPLDFFITDDDSIMHLKSARCITWDAKGARLVLAVGASACGASDARFELVDVDE